MARVLIDTNLLVLLVVGQTDPRLIASHTNLQDHDLSTFELLKDIVSEYDDIAVLPHILTETASLSQQIGSPAKSRIRGTLCRLISEVAEYAIESFAGCARTIDMERLGLTDAVILEFCDRNPDVELLTSDEPLYNRAISSGYPATYF